MCFLLSLKSELYQILFRLSKRNYNLNSEIACVISYSYLFLVKSILKIPITCITKKLHIWSRANARQKRINFALLSLKYEICKSPHIINPKFWIRLHSFKYKGFNILSNGITCDSLKLLLFKSLFNIDDSENNRIRGNINVVGCSLLYKIFVRFRFRSFFWSYTMLISAET